MVNGVFVNVSNDRFPKGIYRHKIKGDLDSFYNLLDVDLIDVIVRSINGKPFDIVCDDEGLLKESPVVSAVSDLHDSFLVGNLFICLHNQRGEFESLSKDDCDRIIKRIGLTLGEKGGLYQIVCMD